MDQVEFKQLTDALCTPDAGGNLLFDPAKIAVASQSDVFRIVSHMVRMTFPVLKLFVDRLDDEEKSWLASMGYLYPARGTTMDFLCTAENRSKILPERNNKQFKAEVLAACYTALESHFRADDSVLVRREDKSIMLKVKPLHGPTEFFTVKISASN